MSKNASPSDKSTASTLPMPDHYLAGIDAHGRIHHWDRRRNVVYMIDNGQRIHREELAERSQIDAWMNQHDEWQLRLYGSADYAGALR